MESARDNIVEFRSNAANKVPPHSVEIEMEILGGVLFDEYAMGRIESILRPEMFYVSAHKLIYESMMMLSATGCPTDIMAVLNHLSDRGLLDQVGGRTKIMQVADFTVSAINIDFLATVIRDKWVRRQLIQSGNTIVELGYETETELPTVLEKAEESLFAVGTDSSSNQYSAQNPQDALIGIWHRLEAGGEPPVLKTGLYDLDELIGGLRKGDLEIVAARSGMGKTQMAVFLAYQVAVVHKQPVVFFSAEMSREKLLCRFMALDCGIDSAHILNNRVGESDWKTLSESINNLGVAPLLIDEHPNPTIAHMRSQVQRAKSEYGSVGLIVLDYLQMLGQTDHRLNRVQELDVITKGCKAIAKDFDVPFLALAQINRGVEGRSDKRPLMSDIKDCGGIEQAADLILLLYRDERYNSDSLDRGLIEVSVGKNRDGRDGTTKFLFDPSLSKFLNLRK